MMPASQLELGLDWGREPWHGVSPRYLTKGSFFRIFSEAAREDCHLGGIEELDAAQINHLLEGVHYGS